MLKQFNSNSRKLNRLIPTKVNQKNLVNLDLTGSLQNIEIPTANKFNSKTKSNPNSTKFVNNKNNINQFHLDILQYSAQTVKVKIDYFDNLGIGGHLFINNMHLNYATEVPNPNNFEIIVSGLHIPGNYSIKQNNNQVVITLNEMYIDFDNVTSDDIYVIGKLVSIPIT